MKLKKYFKRFWFKRKLEKHGKHHKRKAAIFWNKFIRILTIKLVAVLAIILFLFYFGVAYAQAPIQELQNRINKPKPVTQSSTVLSQNIQQAIKDQAKYEIKEDQPLFQTIVETTITQVQEEIFSAPINQPSSVEETLPEPVQEQITQIKQEVPVEQTTEVTITVESTVTTKPVQTPEPVRVEQPAAQEAAPAPAEQPAAPAPEAPKQEAPAAPAVEAPAL